MQKPFIKKITSQKQGKKVTIMWWIHGNEPTWYNTISRLLNTLQIDCWEVTLIIANPEAIKANKRYLNQDLNRSFTNNTNTLDPYEKVCIDTIKQELDNTDILLDLHNTVKNNSPRFILTEEQKTYSSLFNVKYVVTWIHKTHPNSSDEYMYRNKKIWICIECGRIKDSEISNLNFAKESVLNFLCFTGNISDTPYKQYDNIKSIHVDYIYTSKKNFALHKVFNDFEKVEIGEIMGRDGDRTIVAPYTGHILFAWEAKHPGEECFLLWKTQ